MAEQVVLKDLSHFVFKRILSNNADRKFISVEGRLQDGKSSVLLLEKVAFTEESVKQLCRESSILKKEFINDAYGSYECFPEKELNGIKTTVIYPATEDHIKKFEAKPFYIINETKDIYETITLPTVLSRQLSLQWVYNILEHKTETERIIYDDIDEESGFVLLPDLKWDGKQIATLYVLAICRQRNIKSLRDLNKTHLKLLNNILTSGKDVIRTRYNIESSKLRIFVHYQPSFYHFHVHFTHIDYDAPGITCDRAHLLINIINNIELVSDYYQHCTIPFLIKESEVLFQRLAEKVSFRKSICSKRSKNLCQLIRSKALVHNQLNIGIVKKAAQIEEKNSSEN